MMPQHWTINGRFLTQRMTGVQRYAREILHALDDLLAEGHPLGRGLTVELLAPPLPVAPPRLRAIPCRTAGPLSGHFWEQITLPARTRGGVLNLCNTGPALARRQIVCIHDVNTTLVPDSYSPAFRSFYRALLPALGRLGSLVATVSQFSANELVARGITSQEKLIVIPNGHEHVLRWRFEPSPAAAEPDTIVLLGSPAPHKNINLVLGLAPELAAHNLRIAVVGHGDSRVFKAADNKPPAGNVAWLGGLRDEEVARLLTRALCLAFPSRAEGFGLPPLEAMALGCPVIVSDRTSLPEVCGDAALYASPDSPVEWMRAILRLRDNPHLRVELAARGHARARRFSWRCSGEAYLAAMARVGAAA